MKISKQLFIEGHRGFRPLQNCEEGFKKCLELKPHGIETDLWLTKDNFILVHHALSQFGLLELIHKKTNQTKRLFIKDLTCEDMREYIDKSSGQPLLTLRQLFEIFKNTPDIYLNLEIKESRPEGIKRIIEIIREINPPNHIELSSFIHTTESIVRRYAKELNLNRYIPFGFLLRNVDELAALTPFLGKFKCVGNREKIKRGGIRWIR